MTWSNTNHQDPISLQIVSATTENSFTISTTSKTTICPSCGHTIKLEDRVQDLPGLPAGVRFDPSDQEILQHLEAKVLSDTDKLHPLIDKFIPTLEGENGICYTHPEKLPGTTYYVSIGYYFVDIYVVVECMQIAIKLIILKSIFFFFFVQLISLAKFKKLVMTT